MVGVDVLVGVAVWVGVAVDVAVCVGVAVGVSVGVAVSKAVLVCAALLPRITSFVLVTLAVLRIAAPVALALTWVLAKIVTTPPTFSVPTVPVNLPLDKSRLLLTPLLTLIWDVPLKFTPVGNTSWMTIFCAALGPAFVTTIV